MTIVEHTLIIGNTESLNVFDSITHMAFGNSSISPSESQSALQNELLRVVAINITKNTTDNNYKFTGRIPITEYNSDTVYEIGLFDSDTDGNMATRTVLDTGLTKTSSDELVFIINIEVNTINA